MRADKAIVVDEVWDDERIESFLEKGPMGSEDAEFSILLHAYRSMRIDDFERFIERFKAQGYDPQAKNKTGIPLSDVIATHAKAAPFIALLR